MIDKRITPTGEILLGISHKELRHISSSDPVLMDLLHEGQLNTVLWDNEVVVELPKTEIELARRAESFVNMERLRGRL